MTDLEDHLKRELKFDEGRIWLPALPAPMHYTYQDIVHKWTTGYGFNLDDEKAPEILATVTTKTKAQLIAHQEHLTEEEALALLDIKIAQSQQDAQKLLSGFSKLSDQRQFVVICLIYQMGLSKVSGFKNAIPLLRSALVSGDFIPAAQEFLVSKWARHDSPRRAARMMAALANGIYPEPSLPPAPPSAPSTPQAVPQPPKPQRVPPGVDGPIHEPREPNHPEPSGNPEPHQHPGRPNTLDLGRPP